MKLVASSKATSPRPAIMATIPPTTSSSEAARRGRGLDMVKAPGRRTVRATKPQSRLSSTSTQVFFSSDSSTASATDWASAAVDRSPE